MITRLESHCSCRFAMNLDAVVTRSRFQKPSSTSCCSAITDSRLPAFAKGPLKGADHSVYIMLLLLTCGCCSIFGDRLFTGRRWLQPTHAPDRALLDAGYDDLCARFSVFAACPRDRFLQTLADVTAAWSIRFTDRGARQSLADHAPAPTLLLPQTAISAARQEVYGTVAEWDSSHWPLHGPRERTGGHSGPGQGTLKDVATPGSVKQASKDKTKIWHDNPIFMLGPRF